MIKVNHVQTVLDLPDVKEIWLITRKELAQSKKQIDVLCKDNFGCLPTYIVESESLRGFFIGVN